MKRLGLLALAAWIMVGCSKADILNATIPRDGYRVHRDIAYGAHARQRFDIYVPDGAKNAPVILFFYGGSWQNGSKDDYRFLGQALTSRGFIAVVADYRLYPEVKFPAFVEDGAQAFRAVRQKIDAYGGDRRNVFIAGHSAGAYLAVMLAVDPVYLAQAGEKRQHIRGAIGLDGPYNFLPFTDKAIIDIFSTTADRDTQPIHRLRAPVPPVLLATGDDDDTVDPRNSITMAEALRKVGASVELRRYADVDHIDIVLALAEGFRHRASVLEDIDVFVTEHTNTKRSKE